MKIPKQLKINGMTIIVEIVDEIIEKEKIGEFDQDMMRIRILKDGIPTGGTMVGEERMKQVFCHELGHAFSNIFGYPKLYDSEKWCDDFGYFLKQLLEQVK